jgi:hypothetical protein
MQMDEILYSVAERVKNFAVIYLVDISDVPDFNKVIVTCPIICFNLLIKIIRCMNCMMTVLLCSSTVTSIL